MATSWYPRPSYGTSGQLALTVLDIQSRNGTVYVGGYLTEIGGQPRNHLAAVDAATGIVTSWNPGADQAVATIAFSGNDLLVGGFFEMLGGQPRNRIGAVAAITGTVTAFNPNANGPILAMITRPNAVYVEGYITQIAGQTVEYMAEIRTSNGSATGFAPVDYGFRPYQLSNNLAYSGSTLWAGGSDWPPGHPMEDASNAVASFDFPTEDVEAPVPSSISLERIAPHPVRTQGRIRFTLPEPARASLRIYDLRGRRVATLLDGTQQAAGTHEVSVRTAGWKPGCYFYRLDAGRSSATRRMVVVP